MVERERERERGREDEDEDEEAEEIEAAMACVASAASFSFLPARLLRQGGQEKINSQFSSTRDVFPWPSSAGW